MEQGAAPAGGARNPAPRGARGGRPPVLGGLLGRAGGGAEEGRRKPPGSGRAHPSRPRPEVTAPGTEIAAMERRGARVLRQGRAPPGFAFPPQRPSIGGAQDEI